MNPDVTIIDYGAGNVASVVKALEHLGAAVLVTQDARIIARAKRLMLPGVGHFSATRALGPLRDAISGQIAAGIPFLGVCVGMQWLHEGSSEAPDVPGLGILSGIVERFPLGAKVPHVGWNNVAQLTSSSRLLCGVTDQDFVYYTHSYCCPIVKETVAATPYNGEFSAVVERANLFGVQFHPEKSAKTGLRVLRNFLELPC